MFKKFLALCVMLPFLSLWGKVSIKHEENIIVKDEETINFDSIEYNISWNYHRTFLAQDPVVYEEYLADVLDAKKDRKAFDYERAMELTMYYMGFDKNIFHSFCWDNPLEGLYYDVPDYFLLHPRKEIRNLEKAKYWASKIKDFNPPASESEWALPVFLLACEMEGVLESTNYSKLNYLILNSNSYEQRTLERIEKLNKLKEENPSLYISEKKEQFYKDLEDYKQRRYGEIYIENNYNFYWNPIIAYAYYKGIGVEKDLKKAKEYIFMLPPTTWRIFWAGWIVPRDQEFARHILKLHNTPYSKAQLKKIESGFYDER